jgi:serine protease inhibitor
MDQSLYTKFKIEFTNNELPQIITKMGITDLLIFEKADLSCISLGEKLLAFGVIHQAFIGVYN